MGRNQELTVEREFDHARIVLRGDLDIIESEAIASLADGLFAELTATVEVDMSEVTFFGSRAVVALLRLRTEVARHSGAEMRITRCPEPVLRVLDMTGVLDLLALGPALAEPALTAMPEVA